MASLIAVMTANEKYYELKEMALGITDQNVLEGHAETHLGYTTSFNIL
jgi:hypothetical protein